MTRAPILMSPSPSSRLVSNSALVSAEGPLQICNATDAIQVSELFAALKSIVARETKGEQNPWLVRQELVGDFEYGS
jgi:hypothetical protein